MLDFRIDEERCIQCGECAADCPAMIIELEPYPRIVDADRCIRCQHCLAVCPTAAVSILGRDPDESTELKNNLPEPQALETLIRGRRSVRRYRPDNVDRGLLDRILETVWHAPTGVNAQQVLLTVMDDAAQTEGFRTAVYERLEEYMSVRREESYITNMMGWAAKMRRERDMDAILRGAPHVLITSAAQGAPCPVEDALIAMTTFDVVAQSHGLGTVWNGMLKWCLVAMPDLTELLAIPKDHLIGYAMVFGLPEVTYHRTVQRGPAQVNRVKWQTAD